MKETQCTGKKDLTKFLNTVIAGDCLANLALIPDDSIDMIFADPPYWMQTEGGLQVGEREFSQQSCHCHGVGNVSFSVSVSQT